MKAMENLLFPKMKWKHIIAMTPLGRLGRAEDIAKVVVLIASDATGWREIALTFPEDCFSKQQATSGKLLTCCKWRKSDRC